MMALKFDRDGLITTIVQDATTKQLLMVAYSQHRVP
jgi:phosphoribosyl-AMP cyclohydrolase